MRAAANVWRNTHKVGGKMELERETCIMGRDEDLREVGRLRFILDKANRFPGCLGETEERRLMARLTKLERKHSLRY